MAFDSPGESSSRETLLFDLGVTGDVTYQVKVTCLAICGVVIARTNNDIKCKQSR